MNKIVFILNIYEGMKYYLLGQFRDINLLLQEK